MKLGHFNIGIIGKLVGLLKSSTSDLVEDLAELAIVEALKRQVAVAGSLASVG